MKFLIAGLVFVALGIVLWMGLFALLWVLYLGPGSTAPNGHCHTWQAPDWSKFAWCYFAPQTPSPTQAWRSYVP